MLRQRVTKGGTGVDRSSAASLAARSVVSRVVALVVYGGSRRLDRGVRRRQSGGIGSEWSGTAA